MKNSTVIYSRLSSTGGNKWIFNSRLAIIWRNNNDIIWNGRECEGVMKHTPLSIACLNGRVDIVKLLLDNPEDLGLRLDYFYEDDHGDYFNFGTILHLVCDDGNVEIAKLLFEAGKNGLDLGINKERYFTSEENRWNAREYEVQTAFVVACQSGTVKMVQIFLNYAFDAFDLKIDLTKGDPIQKAINTNKTEIVELFCPHFQLRRLDDMPRFRFLAEQAVRIWMQSHHVCSTRYLLILGHGS